MEKKPDTTGVRDTHVYLNGEPLVGRNSEIEGYPGVYDALDFVTVEQGTLLRIVTDDGKSLFFVKAETEDKTCGRLSALEGWTSINEEEGTATPVSLMVLEPSGNGATYLTGRVVLSRGEVLGVIEELAPTVIKETDTVSAIVTYPSQQFAENTDGIFSVPELVDA